MFTIYYRQYHVYNMYIWVLSINNKVYKGVCEMFLNIVKLKEQLWKETIIWTKNTQIYDNIRENISI